MSDHDHEHHDHDHALEAQDAGTQALAEALRSSFAIVKIVMLLMVAAFFASGFFQVNASERAVILRFGKPLGQGEQRLLGPGWHWSFPFPVDEIVRIPIAAQQTVKSSVGWYFTTPEQELSGVETPAGASLNPAVDSYVITADRNIIHTRATLFYHVADPIAYTFDFSNAAAAVQNALNNSLLYTAAKFKADDILLSRYNEFREAVQNRVTDLTTEEKLGIVVDQCEVQSIPPRQLANVFAAVTEARETSAKTIYDAHSYENSTLLNASAQAAAITNQAAVASANYVNLIQADAKRFNDLLPQYRINAALFAEQQINATMAQVLTNVADKWLLPENANGNSSELRLQLNREPPAPKPEAGP